VRRARGQSGRRPPFWAIGAWLLLIPLSGCVQHVSAPLSLIDGYPTFVADAAAGSTDAPAAANLVHFVVEIPAGTNAKWQVDKATGALRWEQLDGRPRVVGYLAYPGSYGMIPSTALPYEIGGDGDPLDLLLLGPRVERGRVVVVRPIGILKLLDDGERDDKILAVPRSGPLSDVRDLASLDARYAGARTIVETWFTHYKGGNRVRSQGFGDAAEALEVIREASRYFAEATKQTKPAKDPGER
jgi:inorganic pyrophosphatase